ncbi:MAG: bifunctional (p)ppGpp synthetase/guanosine-3',5'-bis(diphosphate) 3'-pyrophosphohydrolase [Candidatus Hydrogenedentes bacterium]|nr:bifunctional (p)ppGpp synthetase/guanosine-3',5'-bis(diphosphate) 3'-pyrophosphohydrolase [Candidatus Hydrogenedentota bacterium]
MRSHFAKLVKLVRKRFSEPELEIIRKAYRFANEAHQGQVRHSGEPYILHTLAVAHNLATIGLDPITCAAGILHDVLEDTKVTKEDLTAQFGEEIAKLVDGVTKISTLNYDEDLASREAKQAQNIRKMMVATAKDVRVILIKLADRLHNIRTIEYLPKEKRERISRETLDVYAPLAHRLGISRWKWELEDHSFHQILPEEYKTTARMVAMKRHERERDLNETIHFLEARLAEAEVVARVIGRPKHLYSIYQKMAKQGKSFNEVLDVQAVRIITQTEIGCYNALGIVHSLWTPVPNRLKDYIAMPKLNMYQAIHTTVMRENGKPMEVQIRTEDMDRTAREGIAAHWAYKEGKQGKDKRLDQQLAWLRQMYGWLKDAHAPEELMDSMRRDFDTSHLYVFTPKGAVKELPSGATPLDFAYLVHSDVGHHCIGARVNGRMVPLRYHLQTGDVVEIMTSRSQTPHLDWVEIVVTGRARTRIRQRLRELGMLDPLDDPSLPHPLEEHTTRKRISAQKHRAARQAVNKPVQQVDEETRQKMVRIEGDGGLLVQFAKCCNPMPGNGILGYVTKSSGITVHRADCKSFAKTTRDSARILEASWEGDRMYETRIRVDVGQRPNVLADLTNALRPMNIDILRADFNPYEDGASSFLFDFEAGERDTVEKVMRALRAVTGVQRVTRIKRDPDKVTQLAEAG